MGTVGSPGLWAANTRVLEFITGYLIEKALAVDNVFVWLMLFGFFAVDSIPAIFAITTESFIVLTSNIFAILGLRAMLAVVAVIIGASVWASLRKEVRSGKGEGTSP